MIKRKMSKTRIHLVNGDHVDVQGNYDTIQEILDNTSARWAHFDLVDGTPTSLQLLWIAYITKC